MRHHVIRARSIMLVLLPMALCAGLCGLWVQSCRAPRQVSQELSRGGWQWLNWQGQLILVRHGASPEIKGDDPVQRIASLRGTWGTTTMILSASNTGPTALIKGLVIDSSHWNGQLDSIQVMSRPYVQPQLAHGCRLSNGGGFDFQIVRLPSTNVPPDYRPLWKSIGPIAEIVAVPHWFLVLLSFSILVWMVRRDLRIRRRLRSGQCQACGYDLRATPIQCPECGAKPAPAAATKVARAGRHCVIRLFVIRLSKTIHRRADSPRSGCARSQEVFTKFKWSPPRLSRIMA